MGFGVSVFTNCQRRDYVKFNVTIYIFSNEIMHQISQKDPSRSQFFCDGPFYFMHRSENRITYMVMKMNFRQNSSPITATMMSFFSNLPVKMAISVYAMEPIPIPLAME